MLLAVGPLQRFDVSGCDRVIVYYSRMFQSVQALAQVYAKTGGVFVSPRTSTLATVRRLYPQIECRRFSKRLPFLFSGNAAMQEADVIVTGSPYGRFLSPFRAKKCMVFHGTYMFFTREAIEKNAHFDLLCVTGPRMQSMINRHPSLRLNCMNTGYLPFAEYPERTDEHRRRLLAELGLDLKKKTILYTPSRKSIGSWSMLAERLVRETPEDYNLILRPHPSQSLTARFEDRISFFKLKRLCRSRGNARLDRVGHKLSELLSITDLVVSDANSPAEESLFYDLPQLMIESPLHSPDSLSKSGRECGIHVDDLAKLMELYDCGVNFHVKDRGLSAAIEKAIEEAPLYADARKRYFEWVFGSRDRNAPERVAQAIRSLL